MRNDLDVQGRRRMWNIIEVRYWMGVNVQAGDTVEGLTQRAAEAFGVWEMQRHLKPGDHWAFDLAAHAIEKEQKELAAARAYFETEELLEDYIRTGRAPAVKVIPETPPADCQTCSLWGPGCCKARQAA